MKLLIALLVFITAVVVYTDTSRAGEWQEKPVMCAPKDEIFSMLADKEERLVFGGKLLGKVRDPDEADGLSQTPAILPFALYVNFETKTFTILEYHNHPYNQFCVIGYGVEIDLAEWGDPT
ncbi:MAG: hypothetical protein CMA64_06415 [Euryarchaeota archaeon]|nr:hypothetical protein [Euryarchaeota archaeon]